MKGIILAAGKGTRLYPMTRPCPKPLLPVFDKPMIYYPINTLILAGIREILIIVAPDTQHLFEELLGDGSQFGVQISYAVQYQQRGIADALLVGADFVGDDRLCLMLGDNLFHGPGFDIDLNNAVNATNGATIFGYYVENPRPFGVVEFDRNGKALSLEEKPVQPRSHYIVPGMYFYDSQVIDIARTVQPSARGELEITSVNLEYLSRGQLNVIKLGSRFMWFDTGTAESMFVASSAIRDAQLRSRRPIGCPEYTAYRKGFIDLPQLEAAIDNHKGTSYGNWLKQLADRG